MDILPIRLLNNEDAPIFGLENTLLGGLSRNNVAVADGIIITPPRLKLQTLLNYYNLNHKELFEQTLVLVRKELEKEPVPEILIKEVGKVRQFFVNEKLLTTVKEVWKELLNMWMGEVIQHLWLNGFSPDLTKNLTPLIVIFVKKLKSYGEVYYDDINDDVIINTKHGSLTPELQKRISDICVLANKKLVIPHVYSWILDEELKIISINLYTPSDDQLVIKKEPHQIILITTPESKTCITKVILDLSKGFVIDKNSDGIFIASEQVLNPQDDQTFEELIFKLVESAATLPDKPIFLKLADIPETAGGIRGSLRLLHQKNLLDPLIKALVFCRDKKNLKNIQIIVPYVRHINEFEDLKQELAKNDLVRNYLLKIWLEICVVENILNLEEYLPGLDGVVLNINELIANIYNIDHNQEQLGYFKKEIKGIKSLLEEPLKKLRKMKIPVLISGNVALDPTLLEFLIELGITGVIVPRYELAAIQDLLYRIEKKVVTVKSSKSLLA